MEKQCFFYYIITTSITKTYIPRIINRLQKKVLLHYITLIHQNNATQKESQYFHVVLFENQLLNKKPVLNYYHFIGRYHVEYKKPFSVKDNVFHQNHSYFDYLRGKSEWVIFSFDPLQLSTTNRK